MMELLNHTDPDQARSNHMIRNERRLSELEIEIEAVDADCKALFDSLEVSPEQIETFLSKEEHFSKKTWETIQAQSKELEEKINMMLS